MDFIVDIPSLLPILPMAAPTPPPPLPIPIPRTILLIILPGCAGFVGCAIYPYWAKPQPGVARLPIPGCATGVVPGARHAQRYNARRADCASHRHQAVAQGE